MLAGLGFDRWFKMDSKIFVGVLLFQSILNWDGLFLFERFLSLEESLEDVWFVFSVCLDYLCGCWNSLRNERFEFLFLFYGLFEFYYVLCISVCCLFEAFVKFWILYCMMLCWSWRLFRCVYLCWVCILLFQWVCFFVGRDFIEGFVIIC